MTTLWTFLIAPLMILPIVLLFRFVGCGLIYDFEDFDVSRPDPPPHPEPVPDYADYILGKPTTGIVNHPEVVPDGNAVVGYWRLVGKIAKPDKAVDEKGTHEGDYRTSMDRDLTPGDFITGQRSLVDSALALEPRFFNGGFVAIPDNGTLHVDQFTIEAWIFPNFGEGAEHTLFHAGGDYTRPGDASPGKHGFRVYATKDRAWQVDLGSHGPVLPTPPLIPRLPNNPMRTHLAVIVEKGAAAGTTKVSIVIDGRPPLAHEVPVSYSQPKAAPLLIGVKSEERDPRDVLTKPEPDLSEPFQGVLQEVVLHSKVLPVNEIANHIDINREPRMVA